MHALSDSDAIGDGSRMQLEEVVCFSCSFKGIAASEVNYGNGKKGAGENTQVLVLAVVENNLCRAGIKKIRSNNLKSSGESLCGVVLVIGPRLKVSDRAREQGQDN